VAWRRVDAIDAKLKFEDAESRAVDVEEHHLRLGGLEDEVAELLDLEAGLEGELELRACVRIAVRIHSKSNEEPPTAIIPGDESIQGREGASTRPRTLDHDVREVQQMHF